MGVIEAEALVTVGDADNVFDDDTVTEAVNEALSVADLDIDIEADMEPVESIEREAVCECDDVAVADEVPVTLSEAVFDAVAELLGEAPTSRSHTHARSNEHNSVEDEPSSLKYKSRPK